MTDIDLKDFIVPGDDTPKEDSLELVELEEVCNPLLAVLLA